MKMGKQNWIKEIAGGPAAVEGITANGVHAGLKPDGSLDLALFYSQAPCRTVAFFTKNRLLGAHIPVFRRNLKATKNIARALLVNSKVANCATGEQGERDNLEISAALARKLNVKPEEVLFASTGVIGAMLPVEKIMSNLDGLFDGLDKENCADAVRAIMTTDTRPKSFAVEVSDGKKKFRVGGTAKGSGMICPNMATMFGFVFTDANVSQKLLKRIASGCVERTFNSISVDGDTSPNDTVLVMANGLSGVKIEGEEMEDKFEASLEIVMRRLAMEIVRDGEGATKLVRIEVTGAKNEADAKKIARSIAHSQLVKTALFGEDPNWGRIVSAAGNAGANFDPSIAKLTLDGVIVFDRGKPVKPKKEIFKGKEVDVRLEVGIGSTAATFWTCDLSCDYVKINAEYTT